MNYHSVKFFLHILFSCVVTAWFIGCQKPGPIEVVDRQLESQSIVLDNTVLSSPEFFGIEGVDSGSTYPATRLFPSTQRQNFAQFLVAGIRYDALLEHHEASLARTVIFDTSKVVVVEKDTAYRTIDAGIIRLDGLELYKLPKGFAVPGTLIDTLLGVQYLLLSKDGVGGRGFQYYGSHLYQWESSGSPRLPPFSVSIVSSPDLHVTYPTPRDVIVPSRNLQVRWEGGSTAVRIVISMLQQGGSPKPVFQMKMNANHGGVVIPATVLQILPRDRSSFLFSFISDSMVTARITGYADDVVLQAVFIHNLVLQVSR